MLLLRMEMLGAILISVWVLLSEAYGLDEMSMVIQKADRKGPVQVELSNNTSVPIRLWRSSNSWGWENWTVEKFVGNEVIVFIRRPNEAFTVNGPRFYEIPGKSKIRVELDLDDKSWVANHIKRWPLEAISGSDTTSRWVVILNIPKSLLKN